MCYRYKLVSFEIEIGCYFEEKKEQRAIQKQPSFRRFTCYGHGTHKKPQMFESCQFQPLAYFVSFFIFTIQQFFFDVANLFLMFSKLWSTLYFVFSINDFGFCCLSNYVISKKKTLRIQNILIHEYLKCLKQKMKNDF